jgi:hypothetical protein
MRDGDSLRSCWPELWPPLWLDMTGHRHGAGRIRRAEETPRLKDHSAAMLGLSQLKAAYDPHNFFDFPTSIKPAGAATLSYSSNQAQGTSDASSLTISMVALGVSAIAVLITSNGLDL